MANKYEADLPDGSVAKRNSANRSYVACVAFRFSYEDALAWAKRSGSTDKSNYDYHCRLVDGTSEFLKPAAWWLGDATRMAAHEAKCAKDIARSQEELAGCSSLADYRAKLVAQRVASVEEAKAAGYYDKWNIDGWQGRADLSAKALARLQGKSYCAEAVICAARKVG